MKLISSIKIIIINIIIIIVIIIIITSETGNNNTLAITSLISNRYRKLDETKNKNVPKITRLLTIFAEHGIMMAHNPRRLSQ